MESTPPPQLPLPNSNERNLKIAGLALLGCVALCGVLGTCLLAFSLVYPLFVSGGAGR